jgi:hypothetical protein
VIKAGSNKIANKNRSYRKIRKQSLKNTTHNHNNASNDIFQV